MFAPLVGATFQLDGVSAFPAELVELTDAAATPGWEGFSLLFAAPADAPIAQGTYRVAHDDVGPVDLFLVPVGRHEQHLLLEAVINRRAGENEVS
ncbi:MAG TPA: hypothetical protein VG076_02015 [Acidimicrobiales bacterium]|jgi:hypothetical protein|nr:hypothetical protein [Acidimicrobiales bacterium]